MALAERAPQTIQHYAVLDRLVSELDAGSKSPDVVRYVRHGLHAPGQDQLGVAGSYCLSRKHHGLQARSADLVYGDGRDGRGHPTIIAAWRAGAWPSPAETTFPMMTSSTLAGSTPDLSNAARIAIPPSSGAARGDRAPRKRPIGVRPPPRITGLLAFSLMIGRLLVESHPARCSGDAT